MALVTDVKLEILAGNLNEGVAFMLKCCSADSAHSEGLL